MWSFEKLQAYFIYCKKFDPVLTQDAMKILSVYYQRQRRADNANMARTTVRMLQSVIR